MPRTVTVRVSVVVGLVLLVAGTGTAYVGLQDAQADCSNAVGVSLSPVEDDASAVREFSSLPRDQRAVFLLALEPDDTGSFSTTNDELRPAIRELPASVAYKGTVYQRSMGHADCVPFSLALFAGAGVAILGALTLFGAGLGSAARSGE